MGNINETRGGIRKNAGRKSGKPIKPPEEKARKKQYSLSADNINTLKILGGSKYLRKLLDFYYLKTEDKVFRVPACVYYQFLNNLSGVFQITDKKYYNEMPQNIKYDLTTLQSVYNNELNTIVLQTKTKKILL